MNILLDRIVCVALLLLTWSSQIFSFDFNSRIRTDSIRMKQPSGFHSVVRRTVPRKRILHEFGRSADVGAILHATSSSDLKEKGMGMKTTKRKKQQSQSTVDDAINKELEKKVYPKDGVVSRLKQAAVRASAMAAAVAAGVEAKENKGMSSADSSSNHKDNTAKSKKKIASLRQLTAAIDEKLTGTNAYNNNYIMSNRQRRIQQPARDSMTAVVMHNDKTVLKTKADEEAVAQRRLLTMMLSSGGTVPLASTIPTIMTTKHIAIVFAKPLIDDQISIESATRVQRLVRSMMDTPSTSEGIVDDSGSGINVDDNRPNDNNSGYKPDLICFVGGKFGSNLLSDCDVCYTYFRNLCSANQISLQNIKFQLFPSYVQEGAIDKICDHIQENYVPLWINEIQNSTIQAQNQQQNPAAITSTRVPTFDLRRLKMKLHFTLVSSEYHLCILNDIHVRSPNQSPLRALVSKKWYTYSHPNHPSNKETQQVKAPLTSDAIGPTIDISWTYQYASTATIPLADPLQAFAGKCYKIAQELIPVVQNLRGVVANQEFFQQDNYRVLVAARRSLVCDMEELYCKQPSLQAVQRMMISSSHSSFLPSLSTSSSYSSQNHHSTSERNNAGLNVGNQRYNHDLKTLDIVLESALLSMGRCLDLVRPAGLLTGSVSANEFKIALRILEQAVQQLTATCDPDQPLHPAEWGKILSCSASDTIG